MNLDNITKTIMKIPFINDLKNRIEREFEDVKSHRVYKLLDIDLTLPSEELVDKMIEAHNKFKEDYDAGLIPKAVLVNFVANFGTILNEMIGRDLSKEFRQEFATRIVKCGAMKIRREAREIAQEMTEFAESEFEKMKELY